MNEGDVIALGVSLRLAAVTTAVLLIVGTPLAWWLARTRWRGSFIIEAVVALPLVLPPTVLGFYLLVLMGPRGPFGLREVVFSFPGLVIGSVIHSLPFVVQPLRTGFAALEQDVLDAAETLGAGWWDRFFSVVFGQSRVAFLTAGVLGFAHTLGEFGLVLMLGGSLPGKTETASVRIYRHVETLNYDGAHSLSAVLVGLALLMILAVYGSGRRKEGR